MNEPTPDPSKEGIKQVITLSPGRGSPVPLLGGVRGGFRAKREIWSKGSPSPSDGREGWPKAG